jgi:hypothetical protein
MATAEQRLAELERQVAKLTIEVERLRVQAGTIMALEQIALKHRGIYPDTAARQPARRLHAVDGGAR